MRLPEWIVRTALVTPVVMGVVSWPGCDAGAGRRRQLGAGNPLDRAEAIVRVCEARDIHAVQKLVDLLEDPDRAVRLYAIQALRRLCGVDFGYRYYAGPAIREVAVQRWREALRAGQITVPPPSAPIASSDTGPADRVSDSADDFTPSDQSASGPPATQRRRSR